MPIEVVQLPARDAAEAAARVTTVTTPAAARVQATLPPDQFTSGTYRGRRKKP